MSEHTKEPWNVCENVHIASEDGNGYWISICTDVNTPANARRIVACVNACAGMDTDSLESIAGRIAAKSVLQMHANYIANKSKVILLERQRDELLEAMEEVIRISDRDHDAWNRAKAAIAAVKAGA